MWILTLVINGRFVKDFECNTEAVANQLKQKVMDLYKGTNYHVLTIILEHAKCP